LRAISFGEADVGRGFGLWRYGWLAALSRKRMLQAERYDKDTPKVDSFELVSRARVSVHVLSGVGFEQSMKHTEKAYSIRQHYQKSL
jgi:hypothetical protein